MGNATVSFVGDMATHYIILFFFKWECCQKAWQTVQKTVALEAESSILSISQVFW